MLRKFHSNTTNMKDQASIFPAKHISHIEMFDYDNYLDVLQDKEIKKNSHLFREFKELKDDWKKQLSDSKKPEWCSGKLKLQAD